MRRFQRRLSRLPRIQSLPRLSSTSSTRTRKNRHRSIRTSRRNRPKAANKVAAQTAIRTVAAAVAAIIIAASTETAASAVPNRPPVVPLRRALAPAERAAGRLLRTRAPSRPERAAEAGAMAIAQAIPPGATGSAAPARRSAKTPADVVFSMKASATIIKRANPQAASADGVSPSSSTSATALPSIPSLPHPSSSISTAAAICTAWLRRVRAPACSFSTSAATAR